MSMPERVTITITRDLLRKIDRTVDKKEIKSRSHAIETMLRKALTSGDVDTALVLAGGDGARLRPITYEIPKPLIPVHDIPILEHQIRFLKKYGVRTVLLSVGYQHERIRQHFGYGSRYGVTIRYLVEETPLGTAGPLRLAKDDVTGTFLMLNVDTLMEPDIPAMTEFHTRQDALATLMLVTTAKPSDYGVVRMHGSQIRGFEEKPRIHGARLVNAGLAVLEPSVIRYVKGKMMVKELFQRLARENRLAGFVYDGDVFDVGTPAGYEQAIRQWKDVK